jgi:hypothetical protein
MLYDLGIALKMPSSGMWRRVGLVRADVSDERDVSIFLRNVFSNKTHAAPHSKKMAFFIIINVKTSKLTQRTRRLIPPIACPATGHVTALL